MTPPNFPFRLQQLKNKLLSHQMEYSLETVELIEKEMNELKTENEALKDELTKLSGEVNTLNEMLEWARIR